MLRAGQALAAWQSPGREDLLAYTDKILLPRGISPLRSDYRPHSGRNDIIKQADKKPSPEGEGLIRLTLLNQAYTLVISSVSREIPRNRNENNRTQAGGRWDPPLQIKIDAYTTCTQHLPAVAHRREGPYNRNDDSRTRITDQANTFNATVVARSAERDAAISRKGKLTCVHGQNTCPRWFTAEKTSATETERRVPAPAKCQHGLRAAPAHSPAGTPCRFTATVRSGEYRR